MIRCLLTIVEYARINEPHKVKKRSVVMFAKVYKNIISLNSYFFDLGYKLFI